MVRLIILHSSPIFVFLILKSFSKISQKYNLLYFCTTKYILYIGFDFRTILIVSFSHFVFLVPKKYTSKFFFKVNKIPLNLANFCLMAQYHFAKYCISYKNNFCLYFNISEHFNHPITLLYTVCKYLFCSQNKMP